MNQAHFERQLVQHYIFLRRFYGWKPVKAWTIACKEKGQ